MKLKICIFFFYSSLFLHYVLLASDTAAVEDAGKISPSSVYACIKDICKPTLDDYLLLQEYLTSGDGGIVRLVKDDYVDRNLKNILLIGTPPQQIQSGMIAVNCNLSDRGNCLILYANFNQNYAENLKRLILNIMESDFKGHIIYHIGGWPNVEEGDLVLAHIPYAFKVCAFREARRLGFERAFYLDSPAIPNVSLNDIFEVIQEEGYYIMGNTHMVGPYFNATAAEAFGLTLAETYNIPSCSAGLFGVDFTNNMTSKVIDLWYQAALDEEAYYSARPEQNALSIILYQLGMTNFVPNSHMLVDFQWLR